MSRVFLEAITRVYPEGGGIRDFTCHIPQGEFFALLGMPAYVCASGATPLVAVLIYKGVSPGAALAFLLTGPATNITTFGVLSRLHGRRLAFAFGAAIAVLAVALGRLTNAALSGSAGLGALAHGDEASALGEWSLVVLGALFVASVLRRGPRDFVGELFAAGGEGAHDHDGCDHGEDACGCADECCDADLQGGHA